MNVIQRMALLLLAADAAGAIFWWCGNGLALVDDPVRIVLAGFLVLLLPGWVATIPCRASVRTVPEAVAVGFGGSLVVGCAFALICFWLHLDIGAFAGMILAWNGVWLCWLAVGRRTRTIFHTLATSLAWRRDGILLAVAAALSVALWRWGDVPAGVDWETGLHLIYVRNYATGLPLDFTQTALRPEITLPNLFALWEFLLAAISTIAGVDPLVAALRSRWIYPLLASSCFFFMAVRLSGSRRTARLATGTILILGLSRFLSLEPHPLANARIEISIDRPLFAFLGSIHHSDVAMEILLPLSAGILFAYIRTRSRAALLALMALIAVSFFFHPREYFQVMWYGVIAGLAAVMRGDRMRALSRTYLPLALMFLTVAAGLWMLISNMASVTPTLHGHLEDNVGALSAMLRSPFFESPFNFGIHGPTPVPISPPQVYAWLVVLGLLLPFVVVAGSRQERHIILYFMLLWVLTECLSWSQYLLAALTYNEILMTKVRFLPIIAWVVFAIGLKRAVTVAEWLRPGYRGLLAGATFAGLAFAGLWWWQRPVFGLLVPLMTGLFSVTSVALVAAVYRPGMVARFRPSSGRAEPPNRLVLAVLVLFVLPVALWRGGLMADALLNHRTDVLSLFADGNPTGVGGAMIDHLRKSVPPRSLIMVDPVSPAMIGMLAPVRAVPVTRGQVYFEGPYIDQARADSNPLYGTAGRDGTIDVAAVVDLVDRLDAEYVLIGPRHAASVRTLLHRRPDLFVVDFLDAVGGDTLLRVTRGPPSGQVPAR